MPRKDTKLSDLDLRGYISRYDSKSETRIQRLVFLARNEKCDSPKLAYSLLEEQLKKSGNVTRYTEIFGRGTSAAGDAMDVDTSVAKDDFSPSKHGFQFDREFAQSATIAANQQLETLEANLRTSRSALAKDAIITASMQLANHLVITGQSTGAMKELIMAKSFCSSQWQLQELFLLLAETGLNTQNYQRVKDLYDPNIENKNFTSLIFLAKLNAARGISYLAEGRIKEAAKSFLAVTNDLGNNFNQVLSASDIAMYGGITALLALDRSEIEAMAAVEKNGPSNFKSSGIAAFGERLDTIPDLKEAIQAYVRADYRECLKLIDGLRGEWETDIYLAPQAETLWNRVRGKCLVQYFEPYCSVSMHTVMQSFAFESVGEAENVVADLIEKKEIEGAKIDGVKNTLNELSAEQLERRRRRIMMRRLGRTGDLLLDEVEGMLLRMSCVQKGMIVGKSGGRGKTSRSRRRDWGDARAKDAYGIYGNESSDDDGIGEIIMEVEDEELMDTDDL